jgi:hypothetical protein
VTAIARADDGFARIVASAVVRVPTGCVETDWVAAPLTGIDGAVEPEQPMMLRETTKATPLFSAVPPISGGRTSRTFLFLERRGKRTSIG